MLSALDVGGDESTVAPAPLREIDVVLGKPLIGSGSLLVGRYYKASYVSCMSNRSASPAIIHFVVRYLEWLLKRDFQGRYGTVEAQKVLQPFGLSQPMIALILKGKAIGLTSILNIADYAKVSFDTVIGRVLPPEDSRFPNLERLVAQNPGAYSPGAVAIARGLPIKNDLTMDQWRELLAEITLYQLKLAERLEPPTETVIASIEPLPTRLRMPEPPSPIAPVANLADRERKPE
ncbi:hypothetical protein LZC95_20460 [Pendulispora brunnea]|uniref:Uncharacterized protein n=1 Tax=Pendulispora brunnea TaxID=2905690 RepID=A0ABZ2KKJ8_9BACT